MWLAAAAAVLVAIGAALALWSPEPDAPRPTPYLARGGGFYLSLFIEDRACPPRAIHGQGASCSWVTPGEALLLYYHAVRTTHVAVLIHDADGDWTRLIPRDGGTWPFPGCPGGDCQLMGMRLRVPPGPAELRVLVFEAPQTAALVDTAIDNGAPHALADIEFGLDARPQGQPDEGTPPAFPEPPAR